MDHEEGETVKEKSADHYSEKRKKTGLELWMTLSQIYHIQANAYGRFLQKWGISLPQYELLVQIERKQRLSQKELAAQLSVSKGNITQLLGRLEKLGYVTREKEWKTKYVSLTEKGHALYASIIPEQRVFLASQFHTLSRKDQKALIKLLKNIKGASDEDTIK
ncbi:MarR family transcriptional regulator [Sporolactobacillus sp. THM19-2]|jgi:DNA-binding MarR family transcriptional regulator|nr:MarR family transcriptional regulator [Sporolactobacillus sp. THM19-2]